MYGLLLPTKSCNRETKYFFKQFFISTLHLDNNYQVSERRHHTPKKIWQRVIEKDCNLKFDNFVSLLHIIFLQRYEEFLCRRVYTMEIYNEINLPLLHVQIFPFWLKSRKTCIYASFAQNACFSQSFFSDIYALNFSYLIFLLCNFRNNGIS